MIVGMTLLSSKSYHQAQFQNHLLNDFSVTLVSEVGTTAVLMRWKNVVRWQDTFSGVNFVLGFIKMLSCFKI
jgi:hypothetical protein